MVDIAEECIREYGFKINGLAEAVTTDENFLLDMLHAVTESLTDKLQ